MLCYVIAHSNPFFVALDTYVFAHSYIYTNVHLEIIVKLTQNQMHLLMAGDTKDKFVSQNVFSLYVPTCYRATYSV